MRKEYVTEDINMRPWGQRWERDNGPVNRKIGTSQEVGEIKLQRKLQVTLY